MIRNLPSPTADDFPEPSTIISNIQKLELNNRSRRRAWSDDDELGPRRVRRFAVPVDTIPADFFADPDGVWDYDTLSRAAGFDPDQSGVAIGALTQHYAGFPEGAAVVTLNAQDRPYVAIIECAEPQIGRVLQDQVA